MAVVVHGIASIYSELGVSNAIIHYQDISPDELSSLYWLNVLAGVLVCSIMSSATPLVAMIFGETRLYGLFPLLSLVFLIGMFSVQFRVLLQKELEFKLLAAIDTASTVMTACVSIGTAIFGLGAYAIVVGQLAGTLVSSGIAIAIGWRKWRPKFRLRRSDLRRYLSFSLYQVGERTLNSIAARSDQLLIGAFLGPDALGYYYMAWTIAFQPILRINPIIAGVSFPLLSRVQNETDRLRRGYFSIVRALATVSAPILFGAAVTAPVFIPLLYGAQWAASVPLVQFLCAQGLLASLMNPIGVLLLAKGRADLGFKWNLFASFVQVPAVTLGLYIGGLQGCVVALVILYLAYFCIEYRFLVYAVLGPCAARYCGSIFPSLGISSVMGIAVLLIAQYVSLPADVSFGVQMLAGVTVYSFLSVLLQRAHTDEVLGLLGLRLRRW